MSQTYTKLVAHADTVRHDEGGHAMPDQERQHARSEPTPDRPFMPAGYGVPTTTEGMLPWSHVSERMASALNYWIGTTRPDGRPHAVPVWGAWVDETFYFEGGPDTRRGRNL